MVTEMQKPMVWEDLRRLVQQQQAATTARRSRPTATHHQAQTAASPDSRDRCEVDGARYADHPSCVECTILVGPGHLEQGVDENGRCGNCSLPTTNRILSWVHPTSETEPAPLDDEPWAA